MVRHEQRTLIGVVLDEDSELSLKDLACACGIHAERLVEMVEEGLLEPRGHAPQSWRFSGTELERARTALRLQRDLGINLAGAAMVVELLEELRRLRRRVYTLERRLNL